MGRYDFEKAVRRRGSGCLKWDRCGEDTLPLWIADMDFETAPEIQEQLRRRLEHGVFGYPTVPDNFYGSACDWMARRFGFRPDPSWCTFSPGIVSFLHFLCRGFLKPGDKVLVQTPVYHHFFGAAEKNGLDVLKNRLLLRDGRYEIDFEDFEKKARDPAARMFFLCNPHNPGGRMWTREELLRMGTICLENNVTVVSDEIHCDLVYKHHGKKHIPFASLSPELAGNSFTCIAPSKTFNLAGLQTSVILIPNPELRERYAGILNTLGILRPNIFGITALPAAYRYGEPWLEELLDYLGENLRFFRDWMKANLPMVPFMEPDASYLVWMDFRALAADGPALHELLLNEGRVWLEEGYVFGEEGSGFERFNLACPRDRVREGLERIKSGLEKGGLI